MNKTCNVIMLPTATEPYKMPYSEYIPKSELVLGLVDSFRYSKELKHISQAGNINNYSKEMYQHLYITSDEEIKEGDWCAYLFANDGNSDHRIIKATKSNTASIQEWWHKIIATTDSVLIFNQKDFPVTVPIFPQIPQSFISLYIEEYNKGNKIEKVEVEYEEATNQVPNGKTINWLKINPDNTISIKPIKESWNREEVEELCDQAHLAGYNLTGSIKREEKFNDWKNQNL